MAADGGGPAPGPDACWDDESLVGRATSGDDRAFAVLVARYQAALFRHAWRLTGDRSTAEDVTQDAFLTAWRQLPTLTRPAAFRSWLYQIATRRGFNVLRRRRFDQPLHELDGAHSALTAGPDPAQIAEQHRQLSDLEQALHTLPVDLRAAWALREVDDLSYEEIATVLSVPLSTVRGRIARARRELAERMSAWQTTRG